MSETDDADKLARIMQHFEALMDERDRRYQQRFESGETAILKAEAATEKRFEDVNEFRKTLSDQTATFLPRAEAEQWFRSMTETVDRLRQRSDMHEGQGGGMRQSWGYLINLATLLASLSTVALLFMKQ